MKNPTVLYNTWNLEVFARMYGKIIEIILRGLTHFLEYIHILQDFAKVL